MKIQVVRPSGPFVSLLAAERAGLVITLFVLMVAVGVANFVSGVHDMALYLSFIIYIVAASIPIFLPMKTAGWFHPLIFVMLWWSLLRTLLPHLDVYYSGLLYHSALPGASGSELNAVVIKTTILQSIGMLSLYFGYFLINIRPGPKLTFSDPGKRRVLAVMLLSLLASTAALLVLMHVAGGIDRLLMQRGLPRSMRVVSQVGGVWVIIIKASVIGCLIWLALEPYKWKKPDFLFFFVYSLSINFIATGSRSGVVLPVIVAGSIWILHYKKMSYTKVAAAALIGVLAIGMLGHFRTVTMRTSSLESAQFDSSFGSGLQGGINTITEYGGSTYGPFGIIAKVPKQVDYLYGQSYLSIIAIPIPSNIWPDKPEAGGKFTAERIFGQDGNTIPAHGMGEAYFNFGIPGIIIVMFLFGGFLRWLAKTYYRHRSQGWMTAVYIMTLFQFQPSSTPIYYWCHSMIIVFLFIFLLCGFPLKGEALVARRRSLTAQT